MERLTITLEDVELGPNEVIVGYVAIIRTHDPSLDDPRAHSYYVSSDVDEVLRAAMLAEGWRLDNIEVEFEDCDEDD